VEDQLRPEPLEPDDEALSVGSFEHAVLARVFRLLERPLSPETLAQAEALLAAEMRGPQVADARARVALGQADPVRAAVLRGIEARLLRYLRHEAQVAGGWPTLVTELRFGLGEQPGSLPAVELAHDGDRLLLSGIVDRIDADPKDPGSVIVRDYKHGATREEWRGARWLELRELQVGLYMAAVQRLLSVRARAGLYQPLSGSDLRPRGVHAPGVCPTGAAVSSDARPLPEIEELLSQVEREALAVSRRLRSGELEPCPARCTRDGSCAHPGICWAGG